MNRGGRQGTMMELERRTQQIKEIVRVSAALRADMPPEAICALVAQTIHTTLGFRAAVVNLIVPGLRHFVIAATAGISDAERQRLINDPPPVDHIVSLMHEDFLVSRSYFISHEHKYLLEGAGGIMLLTPSTMNAPRGPNSWHPDDVFFVPLISMRENRLLGFISLDLPEDGKIPTYETAEVVELLANQAATALDSARLFQERNLERQALERGLADLLAHLERMRQRDLSTRAQLRATALNQVASALNEVSEAVGTVLADVRDASTVIQQQATEMRQTANHLVDSAQRQSGQIRIVSEAIQHTAVKMHQIAERAADSSAIAEEAESISNDGREVAQKAGEGMNAVREITLQASKRIKRLGESSQEIGNVIQLVSEFASQTHLLALNAAIEAANAGEHGSGFAIVAREIRNLAQNSNDATKQIHARIKGIQNETNQVAITIEHATQQVVLLSDMVSRSGAALHTIANVIQRVISVIASMHQTAEEQANAAATVSGTMANIADITTATWENAEHMRDTLDRLVELASTMKATIERFRLNERLRAGAPITALPTQPPVTSAPGQEPARDTPLAAAAFAASYPRVTFPTRPSTGAPVPDPYATPEPPANADMELLATMPMPAIQIPPRPPAAPAAPTTPQRPPLAPSEATPAPPAQPTVGRETLPLAVPPQGDPAPASDTPSPPPLFPTSSNPLTPMRLSALESTADTAGIASDTENAGNANDVAEPIEASDANSSAHQTATTVGARVAGDDPPTSQTSQAQDTGVSTTAPDVDPVEAVLHAAPDSVPDSATARITNKVPALEPAPPPEADAASAPADAHAEAADNHTGGEMPAGDGA